MRQRMNDTLTAIMEKPDVPFGTPGFCLWMNSFRHGLRRATSLWEGGFHS